MGRLHYYSVCFLTVINKTSFDRACIPEKNAKAKERMILVLNVVYHGKVAAHVARTLQKQGLGFPVAKKIHRGMYRRSKGQAKKW